VSKVNWFVIVMVFCLSLSADWTGSGFAEDKVAPEQVVAAHVKSIGSPDALTALKTLAFVGTSSVEFIQGMYGRMNGTSMFVSDGNKVGIVLRYSDINYPGEYFAFNGKDVSVGYIDPLNRSPLGDFIYRHNGMMKEGLLGGVLSGGWPLMDFQEEQAWLKYKEVTVDDRRLHQIEYRPKNSLRDMKIKLYFDLETYHHVRTEYRVRVRDDMSAAPGGPGTRTGTFTSASRDVTPTATNSLNSTSGGDMLMQGLPDSIYVLVEKFDDFKKVGAMTLPHYYTIDYSIEGQGHTFIAQWTMKADQWAFNRAYDEKIFIAQK